MVRHVGTQYEARIVGSGATRVRVREGRVDVMPAKGTAQSVRVGEQLLVTDGGGMQRASIAPDDREWAWAATTASDVRCERPTRARVLELGGPRDRTRSGIRHA